MWPTIEYKNLLNKTKMDIQDVLRVLKNGAEKPKDDLNDYTKGIRDGKVQAYSHAWTLVKNLSISGLGNSCVDKELLITDLEEKYKEETGFDVGKIHEIGTTYYSDDYVKWLEKYIDHLEQIRHIKFDN